MNAIILPKQEQVSILEHPITILLGTKNESTRRAYQTTLCKVSLFITDSEDIYSCPWGDVTAQVWLVVRKHLEQNLSTPTLNKYLGHLRSLVKQLYSSGLISVENRTRSIEDSLSRVKSVTIREPRALTPLEVKTVQAVLKTPRDRALFNIMVYAGLRRSEVCTLEWDSVNITTSRISIESGKGNRTDYIVIHPTLKTALTELAQFGTTGKVFKGKGQSLSERGLTHLVKQWVTLSGVETFTPHDCRRTLATEVYKQTGSVKSVQAVLRHENISTSQNYILTLDTQADKIEAITAVTY